MKTYVLLLAFFCTALLFAQKPAQPTSPDLLRAIQKLQVLGSVLYVAAHPDDENTALISYYSNVKNYDVTYLSLTRGDGGQNLIGPELREQLGVLRTEELLRARALDGGKQLFSRANDFGFCKQPEEALRLWGHDLVLSDVVWAMRQTKPDVVINRFYHEKKFDTHGHHTASAMLSNEAFGKSGDPAVFPEQIQWTHVWQPRRLFFNTSWFHYGNRNAFDTLDKRAYFTLNPGVFLPLQGKSNSEIAAESRSMHRCQGMGIAGVRGDEVEFLEFLLGDRPADNDIFQGINTTWSRVEGGARIGKMLARIERKFRLHDPAASVPDLLKVLRAIKALPESHWKFVKLAALTEVIRGCLGLYLEASTPEATAAPGQALPLRLEATLRADFPATLNAITVKPGIGDTLPVVQLLANQPFVWNKLAGLPQKLPFSGPYWLQESWTSGAYSVADQTLRGLAETPRPLKVRWAFLLENTPIEFTTPVSCKRVEPAVGEVWQPFDIMPPVSVSFTEPAYFVTSDHQKISIVITAGIDNLSGRLVVGSPKGCVVAFPGGSDEVTFAHRGETKTVDIALEHCLAGSAGPGVLSAGFEPLGTPLVYSTQHLTLAYPHIPTQHLLLPAVATVAPTNVTVSAKTVGYIMGAGDAVPRMLEQVGCQVTLLLAADLEKKDLSRFDAIVLGIRAFNTREDLKRAIDGLLHYVYQGGNLIVQYNVNTDLKSDRLGPWPIKLSRTRVTEEDAPMRILQPGHAFFNTPNRILETDFAGWVQERGLYFAAEWAPELQPLLSLHDSGEPASKGALLTGRYGKGRYTYTALSFFRQLPAGVPGAMKLFANMLSKAPE